MVICTGIVQQDLDTVDIALKGKNLELNLFQISKSKITRITEHFLQNVKIEKIAIQENDNLEIISASAFGNSSKILIISGNKNLNGTGIFKLAERLNPSEMISISNFDSKRLNELPQNIFDSNCDVKSINFDDNEFKKIPNETFRKLKKLEKISLKNNKINEIEENALNFVKNGSNRIYINLENNTLNESSFEKVKIEDTIEIDLNLENNNIKFLRKGFFQNFINNQKNQLHLRGNKFECQCNNGDNDMKWLLNDNDLKKFIFDVSCNNVEDRSVFDLSETILKCPEKAINETTERNDLKTLIPELPKIEKPEPKERTVTIPLIPTTAPKDPIEEKTRTEPKLETMSTVSVIQTTNGTQHSTQSTKLLNITEPSQRTRADVSQPRPDPTEPNARTRATVLEPKPDPTEPDVRTRATVSEP
jgi:hypothetical protein